MSIAHFFRRPDYQSDATQFLDQLKKDRPHIEAGQIAGRALLWDKELDLQQQAELRAGEVPQQAYVYQTLPSA